MLDGIVESIIVQHAFKSIILYEGLLCCILGYHGQFGCYELGIESLEIIHHPERLSIPVNLFLVILARLI